MAIMNHPQINGENFMDALLLDLPESYESERLTIRAPRPGDGTEMNAAIRETFDDLKRWLP